MHSKSALIILILLSLGCASCKRSSPPAGGSPEAAVLYSRQNVAEVLAFEKLFPDPKHFITHYLGDPGTAGLAGTRYWNSEVLIHDRYLLTMQFEISLGTDNIKVSPTSSAKYSLQEVTSVTVRPSGQRSVLIGEQVNFGPAEWKKLEASAGDLSVLGIIVKKDQPVANIKTISQGF